MKGRALSVRDLDVSGRRVFVRVDFNVPFKDARVADDTRIRASLPTLRSILERGGLPVIASHLGRPKGKPMPEMSLRPVADRLATLLGTKVIQAPDCVGACARESRSFWRICAFTPRRRRTTRPSPVDSPRRPSAT